MSHDTISATSCISGNSRASRFNALGTESSRFALASHLAQLAAASLVAASAGLGAVYAWTVGNEHGVILGALFVLFAIGLELAKPLAVVAAFKSFRSWSVVRGAALGLLALVAISYSLSAELSLMAGARGDVIAQRQATLDTSAGASGEAKRARDRYETATKELGTLPAARPAAELQASIDALLLTPGADGCGTINGKVSAKVCPEVAALKIEKARADRRVELEAIVALPLPVVAAATVAQVKDADPGASSLSVYLAALGFSVAPDLLSRWLALVPVLALEVGSALAGVLVQALSPQRSFVAEISRPEPVNERCEERPVVTVTPVVHVVQADETGSSDDPGHERERVKAALVDHLKTKGGSVAQSERGLAALIGASRPTVRRAISGLAMAGIIAADATRNGTLLRLVA